MRDAEQARPICGDQFAKQFMNEQALEIFERFGGERGPNMSNVARARYIDDLLREQLDAAPALQVEGVPVFSSLSRFARGFHASFASHACARANTVQASGLPDRASGRRRSGFALALSPRA